MSTGVGCIALTVLLVALAAARPLFAVEAEGGGVAVLSPQAYQVVQRDPATVKGKVGTAGYAAGSANVKLVLAGEGPLEWRVVALEGAFGKGTEWKGVEIRTEKGQSHGVLKVPAGGWYRLELRRPGKLEVVARVEPMGVGEVFIVAGQSYAGNHSDEKLKVAEPRGRVVALNMSKGQWAIANDPQPNASSPESSDGSIWPAFGDAMVEGQQVPVGLVNVSRSSTTSGDWLPEKGLHKNLVRAAQTVGRFRAVLWQQGESDVMSKTPTEALAVGHLRRTNPIHGNDALGYSRFFHPNDPYWIVQWARRYEAVCKQPPVAIPERHLSLTLDRFIDGTDRLVLDLLVKEGRITQALARTPTWDGPGLNFHQPGRLFTRSGKALFHTIDVTGLKLGSDGINGTITTRLSPPQGGPIREATVTINAQRHALSGWRGRWKQDQAEGRVEGLNLEDKPVTGDRQVSVQIQDALSGGESWQNWALASAVLDGKGNITFGALTNPNTGWTAPSANVSVCTLTDDAFAMALETEVIWHGVAEFTRSGIATSNPNSMECVTHFKTKPDSAQALLADWVVPGRGGGEVTLQLEINLRPELGDRSIDEPLVNKSPSKPVLPGRYKLNLKGQRLGNVLYGEATVTGPDGKETVRQFMGDVEGAGKP
ncbi:MAG: sialate O-acetylesterase [Phycisphaerae bacterium]